MNLEQLHQVFLKHPKISTDTRKIETDSIFFALKGPHFNGNSFAAEALEKGATYAVIDEVEFHQNDSTILVDNVLETLQKLAIFHRNYCNAIVISLTGSNGKTTTKELIHAVLSKKYNTIATKGNLNNHIGVPLTLLTMKRDTEMAIVEMGANHQKEIAQLANISQPDFGYITNFGKAHLEGFGGVEGVIKGKSELYDYLIAMNRFILFNADDPIQKRKLDTYTKKIGFSQHNRNYRIINLKQGNPFVEIAFNKTIVKTKLTGAYNFSNCAIAILIGLHFGVESYAIKTAIENYIPKNNRSQLLEKGVYKIVLDAYNANPSSMEVALESFAKLSQDATFLFLGDMYELGSDAVKEHQYIADLASKLGFKNGCLVGKNFNTVKTQFQQFESFEALKQNFDFSTLPKGQILIKGSRSMAMERIFDLL